MGMASSQARLLTLTARLHSIEWKAQKIEAEKLRLANDSDRAYNTYLDKLEATKIQYSALTSDGTITFKDATLNAMENGVTNWAGETSKNTLFLQNQEGKILVTPAVANKYGLVSSAEETRDLDTFVRQTTGKDKSARPVYRQEPVYREEPDMETVVVDDPSVITDFTRIRNNVTQTPNISSSHTYNPVENIEGGVDYSALEGFAKFNPAHNASTAGATALTSTTTELTAGSTYTVSNADELMKLMELADATNTAGTTIILTNNIDLSGKNWTGINGFAGTFDGNGYVISNLTGSQGLFASTNNATVKNVGLDKININGSSNVGGLIGNAGNTNITNCYTKGTVTGSNCVGGLVGYTNTATSGTYTYDNVFSTATVNGSTAVGGLLGETHSRNTDFNIRNAYAIGDVTGSIQVGGFAGYMYNDQDTDGLNGKETDINNACAGGKVTGTNKVGGFWGEYLYWGDGGDYCYIRNCQATGKINSTGAYSGAFAGAITISLDDGLGYDDEAQKYVNFDSCQCATNADTPNRYGVILDKEGNDVTYLVATSGSEAGLTTFKMAGSVPTINSDGSGDYMQNILAVLTKEGLYDPCADGDMSADDKSAIETKVKNFLKSFSDNDTDNAKLWYLNESIVKYLNGTGAEGLGTALAQDINNGTKTSTASFQTGATLDGKVGRANTEGTEVISGSHTNIKGAVTIPTTNNIATSAYYALKMNDKDVDVTEAEIQSWINRHYNTSNAEDKMYLANLNNYIQDGTYLNGILTAIKGDTKFTIATQYPVDQYNISFQSNQTITPTYGTTTETRPSGTTHPVLDHYEEVEDHKEYYWDTTDPDIANAIAMYAMAKRGVIVVTEEQASSYNWLTNMVNAGEAVFTTFDPSQVATLAGMSEEAINNMTDAEYEEMMGIKNTSVSVETFMIEVADEKDLKKAEAQYEADMKAIDRKDRQYDTELAKFETERNAIKEEVETLKTVAKENVERTFKLFS